MAYILFDDELIRNQLKPFTFTRPVADIRCGILTIRDKWAFRLKTKVTCLSKRYLEEITAESSINTYINGAVCPDEILITEINKLVVGECLVDSSNNVLAIRTTEKLSFPINFQAFRQKRFDGEISIITQLPHIFLKNGDQIKADFKLITEGRQSQEITDPFTRVYGSENIFVEEGASIKSVILNAEQGPIYIGKNASIQEGSIVIGPVSIDEGSVVVWGSKIRPNTTLGPYSKAGGEVGSSVIFGYSNKAHDGFLGASVIGEWCNLGANCNNSNLKNDYSEVKLYNYATDKLEKTGELFCGLFMGDYTKAGISTMFNTGTVVGVCSNIFGAGFQDKHIPSFMWGGADTEYVDYRFDKALEVIRATMARRNKELTDKDIAILKHVHDFKK
ncbi:glucose-1-phosphate thymidylyltransferase [Emticicia aquatilis]|uniref:Glucose-1-phosphate thymidylyltransferase n=1 Tax=Emticicia aquatilis TaxID=1537369 RepID=A0A916YLK7_9BACT|nr:putative sugar nucleotidyl transferase [Emticicia aquatilis]GGD51440.1 glucose-1-phosphate thymidylyltransferase [Emticicia aquatilis]